MALVNMNKPDFVLLYQSKLVTKHLSDNLLTASKEWNLNTFKWHKSRQKLTMPKLFEL